MKKTFPYLMYAGTIPFIFSAVLLGLSIHDFPLLGSIEKVLIVYALVISSFLAGSHWGQHLQIKKGQWNLHLSILSNVIAVVLWLGFLLLSFKILMIMFAATFFVLLIIDYRLFQMDLITRHYFQTRFFVSLIVIMSLLVSGISS